MCRWCYRVTRMAARCCCPELGASRCSEFPVLAGFARELNTSLFVSRGVGTVYVPVRINCPPDVAVLTLRTTFAR